MLDDMSNQRFTDTSKLRASCSTYLDIWVSKCTLTYVVACVQRIIDHNLRGHEIGKLQLKLVTLSFTYIVVIIWVNIPCFRC